MVMHFANPSNWSNCSQNVVYKRLEIGMYFCESTDFLLEALFSYLELFIKNLFLILTKL